MILVAQYLSAGARGLDLIESAAGLSVDELCSLGATRPEARALRHLAQTYFGQTTFSARQRRAREGASTHRLDTLKKIENFVSRAREQHQRWRLREKLCHTAAADIPRVAREYLRELRTPPPNRAVLTQLPHGRANLQITGDSLTLTDAHRILSASPNPATGLKELLSGEGEASASSVVTLAVVTLEDLRAVKEGRGEDVTVELTNGASLTGAELLNAKLADYGLFALVDPVAGPVNLYRTQRLASPKQRTLIKARHPRCVWPGCKKAADFCQFHHVIPWERGGETNLDNLVPLCAYHNGVNEDRAEQPVRRGKIVMVDGWPRWVPPKRPAPP